MRRLSFFLGLLILPLALKAQWKADFDSLPLPGPDTFYHNLSQLGEDVGFWDGPAYFPTVYDSAWGTSFLSRGFVYTNLRDSVTGTFLNQYSSREGGGAQGSSQYGVCFGDRNALLLHPDHQGGRVAGFYLSNTTYSWHIMKYGDPGFGVEPFGGLDGLRPDWFKLTVRGFQGGQLGADSVEVYLADYRSSDSSQDWILRGWQWVDLLSLGPVDSLEFRLSTSDWGPFGPNTPLYFCLDDFTLESHQSITSVWEPSIRAYPQPVRHRLHLESPERDLRQLSLYTLEGQRILQCPWKGEPLDLDLGGLAEGTYILRVQGQAPGQSRALPIIKSGN